MSELTQLVLDLCIKDDFTFDNFYDESNKEVCSTLQSILAYDFSKLIYIWGSGSSGRSHLLIASCRKLIDNNLTAVYIPLADLKQHSPSVLDELESHDLVCVDDLDVIVGDRVWEEAFFSFYNRIFEKKTRLIIAANKAPFSLQFLLPDLKSRVMNCIVFKISALADEEKVFALQRRAQFFGLDLSSAVALFLVNHFPRNNAYLFSLLKELDYAALREKRKLTIPFVKKILLKHEK
jgi:DnaA family protein